KQNATSACPDTPSVVEKTDDFFHGLHGVLGDHARTLATIAKHAVDIGRIGLKLAHFRSDRRELFNGKIGKRWLEGRELLTTKLGKHLLACHLGESCVDADEVFRLRTAFKALNFRR